MYKVFLQQYEEDIYRMAYICDGQTGECEFCNIWVLMLSLIKPAGALFQRESCTFADYRITFEQ
ncbi:hypothetical protein [Metabacillus litoralis]|uniref:hypothetical protein n=1 Tax=Metabacillus litoralis TaxID=152268 RepID=UPI002041AD61|nr:hypothetical protein [Metabacillus litoralis]MCM3163413.1 hypothetical protein [Metabacillus litoralis]